MHSSGNVCTVQRKRVYEPRDEKKPAKFCNEDLMCKVSVQNGGTLESQCYNVATGEFMSFGILEFNNKCLNFNQNSLILIHSVAN